MKTFGDYVNPRLPLAEDVQRVVESKTAIIAWDYTLLTRAWQPFHLPDPPDPDNPTSIRDFVVDCTYEWNRSGDVCRQAKLTLREFHALAQYNTLVDMLMIWCCYLAPDGRELVRFPQGVYRFGIPDRTLSSSGRHVWELALFGPTSRVQDAGFINQYVLPLGANIVDATRAILLMDLLPPSAGGRAAANAPGITIQQAPQGSGKGYCPQGYRVDDPCLGLVSIGSFSTPIGGQELFELPEIMRFQPEDSYDIQWRYGANSGLKIDPTTGIAIDPLTCTPMQVRTYHYNPSVYTANVRWQITNDGKYAVDLVTGGFFLATLLDHTPMPLSYTTVDPFTGAHCPIDPPVLTTHGGAGGAAAVCGTTGQDPLSSGAGYCAQGFPVDDPRSGCLPILVGGNTRYISKKQRALTQGLSGAYAGGVGIKVDPPTGHPLDPKDCTPMAWTRFDFTTPTATVYRFTTAEAPHYALIPETGDFVTYDAHGAIIGYFDPVTDGVVASGAKPLTFEGGDGGLGAGTGPRGSGKGYCQRGWATNDPKSGTSQLLPGGVTYQRQYTPWGGPTEWDLRWGVKLDGASGMPIDPWTCLPMLQSGLQSMFACSQTCTDGSPILFDATAGVFRNMHLDIVDPEHCDSGTVAPTGPIGNMTIYGYTAIFLEMGGDGGIAPVIDQNGQIVTTGYTWPDPANPALTPAGCDDVGPGIPSDRIVVVPSGRTLLVETAAALTDNKLSYINQSLLAQLRYEPVWDDNDGNIHIEPIPWESGLVPRAEYAFASGEESMIKEGSVTVKIADLSAVANVVTARSDNNKASPLVATSYNLSDKSMLSVRNTGYVKTIFLQNDAIVDIETLVQFAQTALDFAALGTESVECDIQVMPLLDGWTPVAFDYIDENGVRVVTTGNDVFLVTSFSVSTSSKTAHLVLSRLVPL